VVEFLLDKGADREAKDEVINIYIYMPAFIKLASNIYTCTLVRTDSSPYCLRMGA
jgi:hypothetical protein